MPRAARTRSRHPFERLRFQHRPGDRFVNALGEFLEHARHGEHDRGLLLGEIFGELGDRARVDHLRAEGEREVVAAGALEHVRQRQERQEHVVGMGHARARAAFDVGENVAVGEHHALGPARGARGVADRGKRVVFEIRDFEGKVALRQPRIDALVAAAGFGLQAQDARRRRCGLREQTGHAAGLDHEQARAAVLDAPGDVLGVVVHVKRHDHQAEAERGLVGRDPVHAVFQAQRQAVAALKSFGPQQLLPACRASSHFPCRQVAPAVLEELAIEDALGRAELRPQQAG